jgi:hypothetical protein
MRDFEDIDVRQPTPDEDRIDLLLDVARQQEAPSIDRTQQYDRDVIDAGAGVARLAWHAAGVRPQDIEPDLVECELITGREQRGAGAMDGEAFGERRVARARPTHPGLEDAPDTISVEEDREPSDVILVGMREDKRVDAPIPRRNSLIESDEQPVRIRPAIDQHARAARTLHQDRVALSDVENHDAGSAVGSMDEYERGSDD